MIETLSPLSLSVNVRSAKERRKLARKAKFWWLASYWWDREREDSDFRLRTALLIYDVRQWWALLKHPNHPGEEKSMPGDILLIHNQSMFSWNDQPMPLFPAIPYKLINREKNGKEFRIKVQFIYIYIYILFEARTWILAHTIILILVESLKSHSVALKALKNFQTALDSVKFTNAYPLFFFFLIINK